MKNKNGPQPMTHDERLALAHEIAAQLRAHYGDDLLALGLYGSLARGTDGLYSDIEMFCILQGKEIDYSHEWTTGPWKAEVDLMSKDMIFADAAELDGNWAMTHGSYAHVLPLYDPGGFFPTLAKVVTAHTDEAYNNILHTLIVGEIYEMVGKIRNAQAYNDPSSLPFFVMQLALYGAWLIGLANRHLYASASRMFADSLTLPNRPAGYDELCQTMLSGALSEPEKLIELANQFWEGVEVWAQEWGIEIEQALETLLD